MAGFFVVGIRWPCSEARSYLKVLVLWVNIRRNTWYPDGFMISVNDKISLAWFWKSEGRHGAIGKSSRPLDLGKAQKANCFAKDQYPRSTQWGWCIYLHGNPLNYPNVGKYTVHWVSGFSKPLIFVRQRKNKLRKRPGLPFEATPVFQVRTVSFREGTPQKIRTGSRKPQDFHLCYIMKDTGLTSWFIIRYTPLLNTRRFEMFSTLWVVIAGFVNHQQTLFTGGLVQQ